METLYSTVFESAIGPLFLAASKEGLVALEFDARLPGQQSIRPNPRHLRQENGKIFFEVSDDAMCFYISEIEQYFAGRRREFSFPLDLRGTDFQLACWRALLAIPYGETRTYADIARAAIDGHFERGAAAVFIALVLQQPPQAPNAPGAAAENVGRLDPT